MFIHPSMRGWHHRLHSNSCFTGLLRFFGSERLANGHTIDKTLQLAVWYTSNTRATQVPPRYCFVLISSSSSRRDTVREVRNEGVGDRTTSGGVRQPSISVLSRGRTLWSQSQLDFQRQLKFVHHLRSWPIGPSRHFPLHSVGQWILATCRPVLSLLRTSSAATPRGARSVT